MVIKARCLEYRGGGDSFERNTKIFLGNEDKNIQYLELNGCHKYTKLSKVNQLCT